MQVVGVLAAYEANLFDREISGMQNVLSSTLVHTSGFCKKSRPSK